jgi:protoporphyrin/coproporphyrin ferrochelatase
LTANTHNPKAAVLLLAHGSPSAPEEVPEYLKYVTSGRPLSQNVIDEITHRYALVGSSPLTRWTLKQSYQLADLLQLPVYAGMRNWKPFIADVVRTMSSDGVRHAIIICMAPQNSRTSVGLYRHALQGERELPFTIDFIESWHDHPLLIKAFAERLRIDWQSVSNQAGFKLPIIFTAHSVPERTITEGDPYQDQAHCTAELVGQAAGLAPGDWTFAFQSQGLSGGPWIGPAVEETIVSLKRKGNRGVFIQPIGFLCDHVEVMYDIDIALREFAERNDVRLWRAQSLNDSLLLTQALADLVQSRLRSSAVGSSA